MPNVVKYPKTPADHTSGEAAKPTTGDRPLFSLPTKQFPRFVCLHLSWLPRFSRRSTPPQCCRDLRREVFIAQRIISIGCAADFVHRAWFQLISKQLAVRRLSACRIRPPARRKEDAVLTTHLLRPARLPGSPTSGIPPGAPPWLRVPGSIRYNDGRQADSFPLASGKSGSPLPTACHCGDTCGSRTEHSAVLMLSSKRPALPVAPQ